MARWVWWVLGLVSLVIIGGSACSLGVLMGAAFGGGGAQAASVPSIALVPITGAIQSGDGGGAFSDGGAYAGEITSTLRRIQRDRNIKAVVLRIDSPGGGVTPSDEIHNEVVRTRTEFGKPVVVSVGSMAASGGYYIAAAADRIIANRTSITGSIGVITVLPNLQGLMEKIGVESAVLTTGPYKDLGSGLRPLTDDDRAVMQGILDDAYGRFVSVIVAGRKMDEAKVRQLADGRIYTATQAKEHGLLDEFGDLPDAIRSASALVGLGANPPVINYGRRSLFGGIGAGLSSLSPALEALQSPVLGRPSLDVINYLYLMR